MAVRSGKGDAFPANGGRKVGKDLYRIAISCPTVMGTNADELRDLYLEVADEETITESQEEEHNRDPVDTADAAIEAEVSHYRRNHGLDDALEGSENAPA